MEIDKIPLLTEQNIPYYVQIYDIIYQLILDGELKEGDRLPGENILAGYWNVSRSTIRMAIRKLEEDGCIYKMQGKKTTVKGILKRDKYDLNKLSNPCIGCCIEKITGIKSELRLQNGGRLVADMLNIKKETFTVIVVESSYYVGDVMTAVSVVIIPLKKLEELGISIEEEEKIKNFAISEQYGVSDASQLSLSGISGSRDEPELPEGEAFIIMDEISSKNGTPICFSKYRMNSDWYRYSLNRK